MSEGRPARRRVAGERARARRSGTDPTGSDSDGTEEQVSDPAVAEPAVAEPAVAEPAVAEPAVAEPAVDEPQVSGAESSDDTAALRAEATGRRGWPLVVAAVLGALLLAAVAAAGVLAYRVQQDEAADTARGDASAAARSHAGKILSYDHRTLDADFAAAEKALTGSFKEQYTRTIDTVVRPSAEQYKVVVEAEVVAASVVRASADRVVVLLFVNQTTTSTRLEGPKVDLNRVRMTLAEVDGNWLVSRLDAL